MNKKENANDRSRQDAVELGFLQKISARLPENTEILRVLADLYTKTGRFQEALKLDIKLSQRLQNDELGWYNLGCSYALTHYPDEAFEALIRAVELGYTDYDWMKTDPDLNNLRADPRFESLLNWLYTVSSGNV